MRFQNLFSIVSVALSIWTLSTAASANTIDVKIQNFQFNGRDITISVGDTVRWTQFDSTTHTVTQGIPHLPNGSEFFNHSFAPGSQPFSLTFDAAFLAAHPLPGNRYDYFCIPHGTGMIGSVTVDTGPGTLYCFCAPQPACANIDAGAGCPNSNLNNGARMTGSGTASIANDDLMLMIDHLPADKSTLVLRGNMQTPKTIFYDGFLCTGGSVYRFPVTTTGPNGSFIQGPGIVASTASSAGPILAGQTWNFQCYYRDIISPCGNAVNISNGYSVPFVP